MVLIKNKKQDRLINLLSHDQNIFEKHFGSISNSLLIGFDEVGRGCIAGPVCTVGYSCRLFCEGTPKDHKALASLDDSKKVPKGKRQELYRALTDHSIVGEIFYSTNYQPAHNIDESGIVNSIWLSMASNLVKIIRQYENHFQTSPEEMIILIDGPKAIPESFLPKNKIKQFAIKKGDGKSACIAAASNIAKYQRDLYMQELAEQKPYSKYHWCNNVGYGTKKHYEAIAKHGLSDQHRKSFLRDFSLSSISGKHKGLNTK